MSWAYDFSDVAPSGQTLYYNITSTENHTVDVAPTTGVSGNMIIPSTVEYPSETYSVTTVGDNAFANCNGLTSMIIPNSVTLIEESAFKDCGSLFTSHYSQKICTFVILYIIIIILIK